MSNKVIIGSAVALAVALGAYFYTRKKVVVVKNNGLFGDNFKADVKKRIEDAYAKSGSKLPIEQWWAEANKAKGATLSADGKPDILTIKGVGTAEGQSVTGYKLPDNLNAVPVPVTLFFSPNLTPEVFGKLGKKLDNKVSKLIIVDRDAKLNGGSLISEDGYSVTFKPNSDLMVYQDADFNKGSSSDLEDDGYGGGSGGGSGGGGGGGDFGGLDNGLVPMPFYPYPVPPVPVPPTNTNTNTVTIGGRTFERPTTTQTIGVNPNVLGGGSGSGGNVGTPPPIGVNPNVLGGGGNVNIPRPTGRPLPRPRPAPPVGRPRPTGRPPMGRPVMPRPIGRRFDGGVENIDGSFEY